jgi:tetratricopeptide (TPR) repeat protein
MQPWSFSPANLPWKRAAFALLLAVSWVQAQAPATAAKPLRDTTGADLQIPAPDKPTLLLFLRPGQSQSDEAVKIATTLAKDRSLQVIGIISGDDAAAGTARLTAARFGNGQAWRIVTDTDYTASGRYAVRVWPTTVVVNKVGESTAHLAGLPVTFANDLAAHLDFAAGKIDKAGLQKALADREVVADSAQQKAARHVEVALRLAAKGMADQARAELARAVELKVSEPHLLLSMTRVHLMTGNPKEALALLAQIKDGQFPAGEINTLKGWAAVQSGQWDQAKTLLTSASLLNPDPAEACYLLGRVYEHENDLPKAAQFYRKAFERSPLGKEMGTLLPPPR